MRLIKFYSEKDQALLHRLRMLISVRQEEIGREQATGHGMVLTFSIDPLLIELNQELSRVTRLLIPISYVVEGD